MKLVYGFKSLFLLIILAGLCIGLPAQDRNAVMARGNIWINENPGFGTGTVSALFGEYFVENPGTRPGDKRYMFTVRVCGEPRLLNESGWQSRPASVSLVQRREAGNLLIGHTFSGIPGLGVWAIIFCFPQPESTNLPAASGIPDDLAINRLIIAWLERFRYFFSLVRFTSDMSLPAVISF